VRWLRRALAVLVLAAWSLLPAPASAQGAEQLLDYKVDLRIQQNGEVLVTERITYDFGATERHGIFRDLPARVRYDADNDRVYRLRILGVHGSPGTPDRYRLENEGRVLRVRIGDPDQTISGRHDYTIDYRIHGALDGFEDHDELYWYAVGVHWPVPIQRASATVTAPAAITHLACNAGPSGLSRPCTSNAVDGRKALFTATDLGSHEGLAVGVGFPTGVVPTPRPLLRERGWHLASAFSATPWTLGAAGGLLLAAMLIVGWLLVVAGGDRRVAATPGGTTPVADGMGWGVPGVAQVGGTTAVVSAVPNGIRPGQAGLLVDGVVEPVAVGATLVDLAARGYLRIEESAVGGWRLIPLKGADQELLDYERALLDGIFGGRQVERKGLRLSSLHRESSSLFKGVVSALYDDAMRRGWFVDRPDRVRRNWTWCGAAVAATGAVLVVVMAWNTHLGLVPIPIVLAGLLLWRGARRMPRRTAAGAELTRRVVRFRRHLQRAGSGAGEATAAGDQLSRDLPYAIVFGVQGRWAGAFDRFARSAASILKAPSPNEGWRGVFRAIFTGWGSSSGSWRDSSGSWSGSSGSSSSGGSSGGGSSDGGGGGGSW
jgi:uncharacterized protein (TIGR04222 family)